MKKLGIHGSYYCRNFGDTLILYIIKNWVREHSPEMDITLPFVNSEKEAIEILNTENKNRKIQDLDGLVFGPGGYFGEQPGSFVRRLWWSIRNYRRHISWNDKLYKHKVPYMIIGVGVGPISFSFLKRKIIKLFDKADFVSVRDKYSRQYLIDWGIATEKIHLAPDVALTLQPKGSNVERDKPKVALHYPNDNLVKSGKLDEFVGFIKNINEKYEIFLLEDGEGQYSSNKANSLKDILSSQGVALPIISYKDPAEMISNLQVIDKIITSKLHVGIVGYALGKRTLSIPQHSKTVRFYEQIKRQDFCIQLKDINTKLLCDKFEQLDSVVTSDNILFDDAMKNKKVLFKFLDFI
ncbi:polysaccharide pyruvyl transferase family protein [Aequorivita marisscotiae]|uniref:Polysaccharide pyruvyl transferase family protein n=1 Tax=Aequorivita marisscotiae TaxID=3040348 RepID=A0ABY8KVL1_9FLAO|nr:polysaccharide pyruvyl transferase family protein [Aequorivita sp. Ant34-E75]WGF92215.1 polysaccharide pyruvyl transferase family protein [Aequorivita sp. Ant34-E75]